MLLNKTFSTTTTYDVSTVWSSVPFVGNMCAFLLGTENANGTTCDVDIQISLDGTNFEEVISFTQLSATGHELKAFTIPPGAKQMKVVCTLGGVYSWTVKVWVGGACLGAQGMAAAV